MNVGATEDHFDEIDIALAARAAALASERVDDFGSTASLHLVARVGSTRFAIPVQAASGVLRAPPVARVPGAAPALLGVTATGGNMVPVADAGVLLEVERDARQPPVVVLLADGGGVLGLLVDEVEALAALEVGDGTEPGSVREDRTERRPLLMPSAGVFLLDIDALRHDERVTPQHRTRIPEEPGAR